MDVAPAWRRAIGQANLLLAGPAVAVGEAVVSPLLLLVRLNHSVLLELNQTALRVPRSCAEKQENVMSCRIIHMWMH